MNKLFLRVTALLALLFCSAHSFAAERVIEKTDGTSIRALTDYESGDVIRITGGLLTEEDWVKLRTFWTVPFHLVLDNGQSEIPDMALSTNGMVPVALISIAGQDVASVGKLSLANNNYLISADFPALKSIGEMAFFSCMSLSEFILPKSLEILEDGAFAMCKRLGFIGVADGNERFKSQDGVLYSADGSSLLAYPAGKKRQEYSSDAQVVRSFSFYGAEYLERVSFSAADSIGNGVFISCAKLADVALPEGLNSIGYGAFDSCLLLKEITLPVNLKRIGDGAFSYCERLSSILTAESSEHFKSIDGVLFGLDGNTLYAYPAGKRNSCFTSDAREIRPYAFMYNGYLQTVSLPNATSIGEGAFAWCSSLLAASFPSVGAFGNGTFAWCVKLRLMMIGNSAPIIEDNTFTSDEYNFLVVSSGQDIVLEGWPPKVKQARLRGTTATLGPVVVKQGDKLTLSLDIEGASDYRWRKNGVLLDGANAADYEKLNAGSEDNGTYGATFKYDMESGAIDIEIEGIEVLIEP